jgi:hypothetical protein
VSFTAVLVPAYASVVSVVALPLEAGELSMIFWLLTARTRSPSLARAELAGRSE